MVINNLTTVGIGLLFLGIFLIFMGTFLDVGKQKTESKVAFGGFIGFIPFGFANDKRLFWVMIAITILFFLFGILLNFKFLK
jgi:uncharacterized membrane protein